MSLAAAKSMFELIPQLNALKNQFNENSLVHPALKRAYSHFQIVCDPKTINVASYLRMARNELNFASQNLPESDQPFYGACVAALKNTAYAIL